MTLSKILKKNNQQQFTPNNSALYKYFNKKKYNQKKDDNNQNKTLPEQQFSDQKEDEFQVDVSLLDYSNMQQDEKLEHLQDLSHINEKLTAFFNSIKQPDEPILPIIKPASSCTRANKRPKYSLHVQTVKEDPQIYELKQEIRKHEQDIRSLQSLGHKFKWQIERECKQIINNFHNSKQLDELNYGIKTHIFQQELRKEQQEREKHFLKERMQDNQIFRRTFKQISDNDQKVKISGPKLRLQTEPSVSSLQEQAELNKKTEDQVKALQQLLTKTKQKKELLIDQYEKTLSSVNKYAKSTPFKALLPKENFEFKEYQ